MAAEYSIEYVDAGFGRWMHEVKLGDGHLGYYVDRDAAEFAVLFHMRACVDKLRSILVARIHRVFRVPDRML